MHHEPESLVFAMARQRPIAEMIQKSLVLFLFFSLVLVVVALVENSI